MCTPISDLLLIAREEIIEGNLDTARDYLIEVRNILGNRLTGSLGKSYSELWAMLIDARHVTEGLLTTEASPATA